MAIQSPSPMQAPERIGVVLTIQGKVTATGADGVERVLQPGDALFSNDLIQTGDPAAISVEFVDGSRFDLGRDARAMLDSDVFSQSSVAEISDAVASVQAIQQAILAGEDPTLVAEAPAAGIAADPGDSSQGGVRLERTGEEGLVESGFETGGLAFAFPEVERVEGPVSTFTDSAPVIEPVPDLVDEDGLIPLGGTPTVTQSLGVAFGDDGPGSPGLAFLGAPQGLTSSGVPLTYGLSPDGLVLTATAGSFTVFELRLNPGEPGSYTFTLQNVLDHPVAGKDGIELDFNLLATDGNGDTANGNIRISVVDDMPVATGDQATWSVDQDYNVIAPPSPAPLFGNVIDNDDPGADSLVLPPVPARVGEFSYTHENGDVDVVDAAGETIVTDSGSTLTLNDMFGNYTFDPLVPMVGQEDTGSMQTEELWNGVELYAFRQGTSVTDGDGRLALSGADGQVTYTTHGIGVEGGEPTAPSQINFDPVSQATDVLVVDFLDQVSGALVQVSNLFWQEGGADTERGKWSAYDREGNLLESGVMDINTLNYDNNNVGTVSIEPSSDFQYLAFEALGIETPGSKKPVDSTDYYIRSIKYTAAEQFEYSILDGDGDVDMATLLIEPVMVQDVT